MTSTWALFSTARLGGGSLSAKTAHRRDLLRRLRLAFGEGERHRQMKVLPSARAHSRGVSWCVRTCAREWALLVGTWSFIALDLPLWAASAHQRTMELLGRIDLLTVIDPQARPQGIETRTGVPKLKLWPSFVLFDRFCSHRGSNRCGTEGCETPIRRTSSSLSPLTNFRFCRSKRAWFRCFSWGVGGRIVHLCSKRHLGRKSSEMAVT